MALVSQHKEVESELAAARERLQQQASDLVLKASMSTMPTTLLMHPSTISNTEILNKDKIGSTFSDLKLFRFQIYRRILISY